MWSSGSLAPGSLTLGSSVAFGANYARRFSNTKSWAALYWEINAVGSPFRHLSGVPSGATSDIRSVYLTPGVRMQFASQERITPWVDAGAGYVRFTIRAARILRVAGRDLRVIRILMR